MKIVTTCYDDRIDKIGLVTNASNLIKELTVKRLLPVAMIGQSLDLEGTLIRQAIQIRYKLAMFIVETHSLQHFLTYVYPSLKSSVWWNHMASFLILDRSPKCKNAGPLIATTWHLQLLNAKVICRYVNHTIIINFNPFAKYIPAPWRYWFDGSEMFDHPFTVFSQKFRANDTMCMNLDFDKTKNLGGYSIMVSEFDPTIVSSKLNMGKIAGGKFETVARTWAMVFGFMNATPRYMNSTGTNVTTPDLSVSPHWLKLAWKKSVPTYPRQQTSLVIVSQFRGHKTQLEKILYVIDVDSRIGLGVVYLITFIFFKFIVRQAPMSAVLNLVRITIGTGFQNLPHNNASRLFVAGILFFAVTMLGIYQGNLATLLTQAIPRRNVETIKDIAKFGYEKVYCVDTVKDDVNHESMMIIKHRIVHLNDTFSFWMCSDYVARDSSAVCIQNPVIIFDMARDYKLHVSDELPEKQYFSYAMRSDWPLEQKLNVILSRLAEADVHESWRMKCDETKWTDLQFDEEVLNNLDFKVLELNELTFAFVILGIGLTCATIAFIVEVAVYSYKTRIVTVRVQTLN